MNPRAIGLCLVSLATSLLADTALAMLVPGASGTLAVIATLVALAVVATAVGWTAQHVVDYGSMPWGSVAIVTGAVSGIRLVIATLIASSFPSSSGPVYWILLVATSIGTMFLLGIFAEEQASVSGPPTTTHRPA